ncbi:MAG: hypothetical protein CNLJKLNK_00481 [Holosporales bacterium]
MFVSLKKIIFILFIFCLFCLWLPVIFLSVLFVVMALWHFVKEQEKKRKKAQKNIQSSAHKKVDAFLTLIPIFGQVKKCIHFYKVAHLEAIHFFDAFSFLISSKDLPVLNIQAIIPLPFAILADNILFEKCLSMIDEFKELTPRYIFDISFENSQNFTNQLIQLGEKGVRFHVHDIPLNRLDDLLKGFLKKYIHIYQLPHDQLFAFMKNDLMLCVVDDLNAHQANLLITDVMSTKDIDHFPSIVDYVSGPVFEKTISLPLPKSA